jgi:uncharacterized membrane protein YgdD (TMEM256/DUF423 family)
MAGIFGALAVALGAFGAHALKERETAESLAIWATAAHYHLIHSLMLAVHGLIRGHTRSQAIRAAGWFFVAGIIVFSGSLYLMVLTGDKWLGAITPIGGLCLIVGWILTAVGAVKVEKKRDH